MEKSKIKKIMARNISNEELTHPYYSTKRKATYWFNILNTEIFGSKLTKFTNIVIVNDLRDKTQKLMAECEGYWDKDDNPVADLRLTDKFKSMQQFISVLAHEMIHFYQWVYTGTLDHTKHNFFNPWSDKFAKHGIKLSKIY